MVAGRLTRRRSVARGHSICGGVGNQIEVDTSLLDWRIVHPTPA